MNISCLRLLLLVLPLFLLDGLGDGLLVVALSELLVDVVLMLLLL